MDQRAAPAAARGEALGQHAARRRRSPRAQGRGTARRGAPGRNSAVLLPVLRGDFGDDLLRQHVQRLLRDRQPVEFAAPDAVEQRRAFDQIVARQREQPALRRAADRVAGASDALQEARRSSAANRAGRRDRRRRCRCRVPATRSRPAPSVRRASAAARRRGDVPWPCCRDAPSPRSRPAVRTDARATRSAMPARVDEHQRRAVLLDELRRAGRRPASRPRPTSPPRAARPALRARDRARARWPASTMTQAPAPSQPAPTRKRRDGLDRLLRRRQPDALQARRRRAPASRSSDSARCAPRLFGARGVDFVDDDGARRRQHLAPGFRAEQHVKRFRRGHDDVRRAAAHPRALGAAACRRCAPRRGCRRRAARAAPVRARMPASGASRLRWMSFDSALSGET